uniref:Uncharacterized protein n=1 Tax=Cannabis sativa TaxID=3483 RepID=A0A803R292_CANSA
MYAEAGLLFPCFQNFSQELQQYDEFCRTEKSNVSMSNMVQVSMISEYDMGAEGDLFKAPEPIIEEAAMGLDPVTAAAISMVSCGEDVISRQALKVADIESFQKEQLLSEVLYECEKDLLEQAAMDMPLSEVLDIKIPSLRIDENFIQENKLFSDSSFQKSISSECLSSMEWMQGPVTKPNFLDFPGMDLGAAAYGMRRAFSEGDIKDGAGSLILSFYDRLLAMVT